MASLEIKPELPETSVKRTPMICPIVYTNSLPDPEITCKFLPCAKTLDDYVEEPISMPELELQYTQNFKGLHMLLNIDLLNPKAFEIKANGPKAMDEKDAAVLADIEALSIDKLEPEEGPPTFDPSYMHVRDNLDKWVGEKPAVPISPLAPTPNIMTENLIQKKSKRRHRSKH